METNVGGLDRPLRIIAGLVILSMYFFLGEENRLWALIGLVPLATGLAGWCPLYTLLGIRTCKVSAKR